jgi:hypothetical protein
MFAVCETGTSGTDDCCTAHSINWTRHYNGLRPKENFGRVNLFVVAFALATMHVRLGLNEEFEPGQHGQFRNLIYTDAAWSQRYRRCA